MVRTPVVFLPLVVLGGCSDKERPPVATETSRFGDAGGRSPAATLVGPVDGGVGAACTACNERACKNEWELCSQDSVCSGCFTNFSPACFNSSLFERTRNCACGNCAGECGVACQDLRCLKCVVNTC